MDNNNKNTVNVFIFSSTHNSNISLPMAYAKVLEVTGRLMKPRFRSITKVGGPSTHTLSSHSYALYNMVRRICVLHLSGEDQNLGLCMSSHAVQTHVKLILYHRKAQASVAFFVI